MNANELADVIGCVGEDWAATIISNSTLKKAATMLRQQQAEIEELRNQLWELKSEPWGFDTHPIKEQSTNERIEMLKEMVEKSANAVGWIGYQEGHLVSFLKTQEQVNSFLTATDPTGRVEPVYTHPVKEQLTDEEIYGVWFKYGCGIPWTANTKTFIRAILRKAQENG